MTIKKPVISDKKKSEDKENAFYDLFEAIAHEQRLYMQRCMDDHDKVKRATKKHETIDKRAK